ncbi:MAG TPA: hypothetical protein VHI12_05635, partial [Gaiellaceae bacterium]|nr:hypothetical protein [Gaiellaceae bacterium]
MVGSFPAHIGIATDGIGFAFRDPVEKPDRRRQMTTPVLERLPKALSMAKPNSREDDVRGCR